MRQIPLLTKNITLEILENDFKVKKECYICRSKKELEIHHKIPRGLGGLDMFDNIIFLCNKHHQKLHDYFIKFKKNPNQRDFIKRLEFMKEKLEKKGYTPE